MNLFIKEVYEFRGLLYQIDELLLDAQIHREDSFLAEEREVLYYNKFD